MSFLTFAWDWLTSPQQWQGHGSIQVRLLQHLGYTGLSLLVAALIALPLGLLIGHYGRGGFAVINRLQNYKGVPSFNNLLRDCRIKELVPMDFARHAEAMGAIAEHVRSVADLERALQRAKAADRTSVIVIDTDPNDWTPGDAWWDVGVPATSPRESVRKAAKIS